MIELFEKYSRASLYHGLKMEYAYNNLIENEIKGYTWQRYWEDGKRRKDDDPEYQNSYYLKGLSLTREKSYAQDWAGVVFEFDQDKLRDNYKIVPYNWGYSIGGNYVQPNKKRESEEFLVTGKIEKSMTNIELVRNVIDKPVGSLKPLDKFLIGFYIDEFIISLYKDNDELKYLLNHPKFLGTYTKSNYRKMKHIKTNEEFNK